MLYATRCCGIDRHLDLMVPGMGFLLAAAQYKYRCISLLQEARDTGNGGVVVVQCGTMWYYEVSGGIGMSQLHTSSISGLKGRCG